MATSASQRCHWKPNESGFPDQLPSVAVRVCPTLAVPEIVGGAVFFGPAVEPGGGDLRGLVRLGRSRAVRIRGSDPDTHGLTRVGGDKRVRASGCRSPRRPAGVSASVASEPLGAENEDGLFVQVPLAAVRICPTCVVPEMVGGAVFTGAAAIAA